MMAKYCSLRSALLQTSDRRSDRRHGREAPERSAHIERRRDHAHFATLRGRHDTLLIVSTTGASISVQLLKETVLVVVFSLVTIGVGLLSMRITTAEL